jgi:hypothetical protein
MNSERSFSEQTSERAEIKNPLLRQMFEKINSSLQEKLDVSRLSPKTITALEKLDEATDFLKDESQCIDLAVALFKKLERYPELRFSERQKMTALVGTLLSDTGKIGPESATPQQQQLICDIYRIREKVDPKTKLGDFVTDRIASKQGINLLKQMRLDPNMTMRDFYDIHSKWSGDIVGSDPAVPREAVVAAELHHLFENVPHLRGKISDKGEYENPYMPNKVIDRADLLVIFIDKYDAWRFRRKLSHADTMLELRKVVAGYTGPYSANPEFKRVTEYLLREIDTVFNRNPATEYYDQQAA